MDAARSHAEVAAAFTDRVLGVQPGGWEAPAPVEGWTACDVVGHLVMWFPGFLEAGAGVSLPAGPPVQTDPVAAWLCQRDAVQQLLDDPETRDRTLVDPHLGTLPLAEAVDRFYVADVFMHTWDLARATGQDETLDPVRCDELYRGLLPLDGVLRASGQYGPRVDVPEDADIQTKLLGFIGRRP